MWQLVVDVEVVARIASAGNRIHLKHMHQFDEFKIITLEMTRWLMHRFMILWRRTAVDFP